LGGGEASLYETNPWRSGNDVLYTLELASDSIVELDLVSDFDSKIYVRPECLSPFTLACSNHLDGDYSSSHIKATLPSGSWSVIVDSDSDEEGNYQLDVTITETVINPCGDASCGKGVCDDQDGTAVCLCNENSILENGKCVMNKMVKCNPETPENAKTIVSLVSVNYSDSGGWHFPSACDFECHKGFKRSGNLCIPLCKDVSCGGFGVCEVVEKEALKIYEYGEPDRSEEAVATVSNSLGMRYILAHEVRLDSYTSSYPGDVMENGLVETILSTSFKPVSNTVLIKIDSEGKKIWKKEIFRGGAPINLLIDSDENLIAVGNITENHISSSYTYIPPGGGGLNYYSNSDISVANGIYIRKVDKNGENIFSKRFFQNSRLKASYNGSFYENQEFKESLYLAKDADIDHNDTLLTVGGARTTEEGDFNILTLKTDPKGTKISESFERGSDEDDFATAVTFDNGFFYVAGATEGSFADFNQGSSNLFIFKEKFDGEEIYVRQYAFEEDLHTNSITTDRYGNILLTGHKIESDGVHAVMPVAAKAYAMIRMELLSASAMKTAYWKMENA